MNPERWQEIEKLYNSALGVEPSQRESFLNEACAGDESLRKEVEQLLASQPQIERFIESPAMEVAARGLAKEQANVLANDLIGRTIAHYRIQAKIGQGGMGEVFLADDTSLHRKVALKFLPPEMQQDPVAHKRFLREARSAAALDNPYICSVHEVGEFEGKDFIVMEYVDGQTLMDKLRRGRLPLNQALQIATEVAEALQTAHGKGIVHRDLKPSNIMLMKTGHAKVMDFGLAKQIIPPGGIESQEEAISAMTRTGMTIGTLAYMSPEQLRGDEVDARSDIFSFGVVLYEMLAGIHPFKKATGMDTAAAILHEEPDLLGKAAKGIPPNLETVIGRCLRKDLARRFHHMDDVKVELEEVMEQGDSAPVSEAHVAMRGISRRWLWTVAICIVLLAAGTWIWRIRMGSALPPPKVVELTSYAGYEFSPTFSPDGNKVAFVWNKPEIGHLDIYVKAVGETHALQLTSDPAGSYGPAWSPDDRYIAFARSGSAEKTGIYLVSPISGPERKIFDFPSNGRLSWTPDSRFLASARDRPSEFTGEDPSGIYLIPIEGGTERRLTHPKAPAADTDISISPDGRLVCFVRYAAAYNGDIYCQPFGQDGSNQGEPRRITHHNYPIGEISWSRDGESVVYSVNRTLNEGSQLWRAWVGADVPPTRVEIAGLNAFSPAVAPSKNRLAFASGTRQGNNIWRLRLGGTAESLLTSPADEEDSEFSPDGQRIVFQSTRAGSTMDIWVSNADGSNPVQLTHEEGSAGTPHWSGDGQFVIFDLHAPDGSASLYSINANGGRARRLTPREVEAVMGCWSPDGKWIYFTSNRSGVRNIWRIPAAGGEFRQITRHGADRSHVSLDGRTVYFTKETSPELFAIPSDGGDERKIADSVEPRCFTVAKGGIYYIKPCQKGPSGELHCIQPETSRDRFISVLEGNFGMGLTVSPDGKTVLYSRSVYANADLMLLENFR